MLEWTKCPLCGAMLAKVHGYQRAPLIASHLRKAHPDTYLQAQRLAGQIKIMQDQLDGLVGVELASKRYFLQRPVSDEKENGT